jgi:microcystin-dependent protein
VIGTTWGAGDGSTTFNLPSKAGLVTVGVSTDDEEFNTIGDTFGEKEHRLTINEMPSHKHVEQYGDLAWVDQNGLGNTTSGYKPVYESQATLKANITKNTGGGQAHNNIQPTVVSNFIIKAANVSQLPDEAEVVDGYSTSTTDAYSANYINNMILNAVYPVGSIYMSINSTSPATLFGGRWEAISQGRTLVGVGTGTDINGDSMTWAAETEGGEYFHTLSIDEMPSHSHSVGLANRGTSSSSGFNWAYGNQYGVYGGTEFVIPKGGGQAHNNIQPFFAVYMWKRTA